TNDLLGIFTEYDTSDQINLTCTPLSSSLGDESSVTETSGRLLTSFDVTRATESIDLLLELRDFIFIYFTRVITGH
ncbi:hypothetical protein ACPWME_21465, partial [Pandoraea pneumonica]|uniref:hypothetical protein n=1 Tax=Pandoraea pneumonica TaxID=2508299 RepID=UPI003CE7E0D7